MSLPTPRPENNPPDRPSNVLRSLIAQDPEVAWRFHNATRRLQLVWLEQDDTAALDQDLAKATTLLDDASSILSATTPELSTRVDIRRLVRFLAFQDADLPPSLDDIRHLPRLSWLKDWLSLDTHRPGAPRRTTRAEELAEIIRICRAAGRVGDQAATLAWLATQRGYASKRGYERFLDRRGLDWTRDILPLLVSEPPIVGQGL